MPDPAPGGRVTARLFDADRTDEVLELDVALGRRLGRRQLLWIDVEGVPDERVLRPVAGRLGLTPRTYRRLLRPPEAALVAIHGPYVHVRVAVASVVDPGMAAGWLDIIASRALVLTSHPEPFDLLRSLDERMDVEAPLGVLDGPVFAASVLGSVVTGYLAAVDAIEDIVDDLDGRALRATLRDRKVLGDLVAVRRQIARLRRLLTDQREVFAAVASAEFGRSLTEDAPADFRAVADRFEGALASVEDARELLLGSFEVYMTRTAQRTNDIMKVLALATVLLLPGSLMAALLGMNMPIPLPEDLLSFWVVTVAIGLMAIGVLVAARMRRWV